MRAGHIPYGFKAGEDKFLAIEESEIAVLRKMDDLRSRGVSYAKMVAKLNKAGVLNRHGRPWNTRNLYVCYQGWCEDGRDRAEWIRRMSAVAPECKGFVGRVSSL